MPAPQRLYSKWRLTCRRLCIPPTPEVLLVSVRQQRMWWLERHRLPRRSKACEHRRVRGFLISTSRFGVGQLAGSNCTPLGLHRVALKIGAGWPVGTVFIEREPVGFTWQDRPDAAIAHRILWLEGLEPGVNRGGEIDTFSRHIYIHGVGDEMALGKPASHGCIHMRARDLLWLFDRVRTESMVWIDAD